VRESDGAWRTNARAPSTSSGIVDDEPVLVGDRQPAQQHRVGDGEHGRREADAEREDEHRRRREAWRAAKVADAEPDVLEQVLDHGLLRSSGLMWWASLHAQVIGEFTAWWRIQGMTCGFRLEVSVIP
jgi:hypothetical protein